MEKFTMVKDRFQKSKFKIEICINYRQKKTIKSEDMRKTRKRVKENKHNQDKYSTIETNIWTVTHDV